MDFGMFSHLQRPIEHNMYILKRESLSIGPKLSDTFSSAALSSMFKCNLDGALDNEPCP